MDDLSLLMAKAARLRCKLAEDAVTNIPPVKHQVAPAIGGPATGASPLLTTGVRPESLLPATHATPGGGPPINFRLNLAHGARAGTDEVAPRDDRFRGQLHRFMMKLMALPAGQALRNFHNSWGAK